MKSTLRDSDNENDPYPPAKRKKITSSCRVPSLMEIAIDFVASNLHHVESFCGFPDIVGQEIFRRAELMKRFDISNDGDARCLRLFIDSYGALVLSQLNLSGCHLGVNYALDNLLHFKSLEELDVSACGLGDSHEFLPYIGHLESLRKLNLSSNSLTDEGMRKLTTPYRVCGKGPKHLEICDISDNPTISSKSIQRLSSFPELHTVDVTKTQIKVLFIYLNMTLYLCKISIYV
ncbi:hypothetical protein FSP39_002959 [Pinctada imbricata]|uniref:Leucine-rich repeat-containing protein 42 n=1 Tax=Pinctada imbricata TaxID=66713 RepID=A0AA89BPM8_PINIB|nr:hypothetical protein FSP39_002959 [Pinctada imbricata]